MPHCILKNVLDSVQSKGGSPPQSLLVSGSSSGPCADVVSEDVDVVMGTSITSDESTHAPDAVGSMHRLWTAVQNGFA